MTMKKPHHIQAENEQVKQQPFFQKERNGNLSNKNFFADPTISFFKPTIKIQNKTSSNQVQLKPNDKHDLTAKELTGDAVLEKAYDHETVISKTKNSKGAHVKKLRDALKRLKVTVGESKDEEIFDKATEDAVKEFQQNASMSKNEWDGIVGRKTIGLLDRSLRNNTISTDTDNPDEDFKLKDPKKKADDEACKGKATDKACPNPNTDVNTGADDAIKRIDKVVSQQLPPVKDKNADYPAIFTQLFRNNDTRPIKDTSDEVKTNFGTIKTFVQKLKTDPTTVRCGTECDGGCRAGSPAYHSTPGGVHIITFCPDFAKDPERTSIVIHECHHASVDKSRDIAYQHTRLIDKLDHTDALLNAASFHLYAALVEDPKSDFIGPKVKDTNSISDAGKKQKVDKALAFLQQWFHLVTFDMSKVSQSMDEAKQKGRYAAGARTDLINDIYVKWFQVTPAPGRPKEADVNKAKAIEERSVKMEKAFDSVFTITESATASDWERGPGQKIQLNKQLTDLDVEHMVIALLQELVHATPDISANIESLYVGTINALRNDRGLAP
jgi:peptidoglycan hydrolase-like protein with peptidoglycan-binding domain